MNYQDFINECNEKSIDAIMLFLDKLNIITGDELLQDQINIPVNIGKIGSQRTNDATGEYNEQDDEITINIDEFNNEELQDFNNKNVQFYFTKAIVHERIHSLRRRKIEDNILDIDYTIGIEDELISNKNALEECTTEALALMITFNYFKNNNITLEELTNKVKKFERNIGEGLSAKLIQEMGTPAIEWFLTTRYQNRFKDEFREFLQEDYERICDYMTIIYLQELQELDQEEYLEEIIEKHSEMKGINK